MRLYSLLFFGLTFILYSCTPDLFEDPEVTACRSGDFIKSKEVAGEMIKGTWIWQKTTYQRRGVGTSTETPGSTSKTFTLEFTDEKARLLENGNISEEKYEISFWGEGTNTIDDILVIRFYSPTGEFMRTSMLFLNSSGTCLTLGNSYNDAGGDLTFNRAF